MDYQLPFILYDSECQLCVRFKQGLEMLDKNHQLHFYPLQDAKVFTQFPFLDPQKVEQKVHLVTTEQKVLEGGEVVEYLLKMIPGVEKFSWLLDNNVSKKTMGFFYDTVDFLRKNTHSCNSCSKDKK
ncbi:MAG: DUF393 domain-containing protein [Bacteriovoracaceae bacterium]|nr:DUF393 domain-containing protein [Bacteriovoracaceae bacterium]